MTDETPLSSESHLTPADLSRARIHDSAYAHIDLRKNLARYREPDPTPEDYAHTYVRMMLRVSRPWAIMHLTAKLNITHERADLAIENQIKNGKLIVEGGDLVAKVAEVADPKPTPWLALLTIFLSLAVLALSAWLIWGGGK